MTEERWFWLCLTGLLVAGWGLREVYRPAVARPSMLPDIELTSRVADLERRADEQMRVRCMNFTTGQLDLAIFPVDNLGKKKVETK